MRIVDLQVSSEVDTLPGNTQMCVFHAVTNFGARGKGNGHAAHSLRLQRAKALGYQVAICTTDAANEPQLAIMKTFKWIELQRFTSKRTGHTVILWSKEL